MRLIAKTVPFATVLLLALLSVIPWGLGEGPGFTLPALPFVAIHYWSTRHASLLPAPLVFLAGLGVDVLSHGPLGYWSLVYLAGIALTHASEELMGPAEGVGHWLGFCGAMAGLMAVAWLLASAYFARAIDWWPMAVAALILVAVYPVLAGLMSLVENWVAGPQVLNLERRG